MRIVLQAAVQEIEALERKLYLLWEHVVAFLEVVLQIALIHSGEWSEACQHFIENCAQAPDIYFVVILFTLQNLRRHIKRSSTHRLRQIAL